MRCFFPILALFVPLAAWAGDGFSDIDAATTVTIAAKSDSTSATGLQPVSAPAVRGSFRLEPSKSHIYARLYKSGFAGAFAHDHVIEARSVTGTATLDQADLAHSSVQIDVSVTGLYPDSDEMRSMLDLPKTLSDRERDEITDHLRSEGQLWAEKYDKVTFRSTKIEAASPDQWQVTGDFTLRGVTHSITLPMTVSHEGTGVRAKGQFHILQSDYGYKPYTALLGAIQNQDPADVVIDALLVPSE